MICLFLGRSVQRGRQGRTSENVARGQRRDSEDVIGGLEAAGGREEEGHPTALPTLAPGQTPEELRSLQRGLQVSQESGH